MQWLLSGGGVALSAAALIDDLAAGGARLWMSVLPVVLAVVLGVTMRPIVPPAVGWAVVAGRAVAVSFSRGLAGPALPDRRSRALLALAVALAALGAAGEDWARESTVTLASGAQATVPVRFGGSYTLTHQGISRFEDRNAHVQALALEPSRGGRQLALLSAERRAYVDSRDEVLGETVRRPATQRWGLESLRVRLDDVTADEGVRLRLTGDLPTRRAGGDGGAAPRAKAGVRFRTATALAAADDDRACVGDEPLGRCVEVWVGRYCSCRAISDRGTR